MSYNPQTYWPQRFRDQGKHYVAKGGRESAYHDELREIGKVLRGLLWKVPSILDFGCGPGRFADILASYCDKYTGFDLVPESAALNPHPTTNKLSGVYDIGVAIEVFQHIPDDETIKNAGRHAKAWLVVDHLPLETPNAHMRPRSPEQVGELLGLAPLVFHRPVLGHWVAVYQ